MSKQSETEKNITETNSIEAKGLLTGVLIGGVLGIAVGTVVTLLARIAVGVLRKILKGDDGNQGKTFDPRWLLQ
jgi:hypothetical protein